eukprot:SAG22_NODE_2740_length_2260_cov_2.658491_1_plen_61_part_10
MIGWEILAWYWFQDRHPCGGVTALPLSLACALRAKRRAGRSSSGSRRLGQVATIGSRRLGQ